ncbi:hypothetical protein KKF81_05910 [Candidatus Micrarchaeota archaeon]|nr:hypothetical protein [Candidatus Micrarchaeota archaeon]MBU1166463.1 hypothetical protein [Candidatus Micrarchaeota archaeon]MBU1886169.1 hypothetical protein [Candidatus Micrarchaeota archaeon]
MAHSKGEELIKSLIEKVRAHEVIIGNKKGRTEKTSKKSKTKQNAKNKTKQPQEKIHNPTTKRKAKTKKNPKQNLKSKPKLKSKN